MMKVILKVKDKGKISDLKQFGNIVYTSPILNVIGLEIEEKHYKNVKKHSNVLTCQVNEFHNTYFAPHHYIM